MLQVPLSPIGVSESVSVCPVLSAGGASRGASAEKKQQSGYRLISVLWRTVNHHGRCVFTKIVVTPHMNLAVRIGQSKRRTAEIGRFDLHR